jgi:hypothetical protein
MIMPRKAGLTTVLLFLLALAALVAVVYFLRK